MRGNAAIPTKAHWIEPEFAFTLRTPNVDVGRLCALVRVKVKPKSAYSEYRWHPFKVLPLGHAGKFCSGQGGDVTAIPVRQRPFATSCQPLPPPALRRFLRHLVEGSRYLPSKQRFGTILLGELWPFLKVAARGRTKPQSDASRSAAWSFDGDAVLTVRGPAGSCEQRVRRFLRRGQKRARTGS